MVIYILRGPNGDNARDVCSVWTDRAEPDARAARYNAEDGEGVWTVEAWRVHGAAKEVV